MKGFLREESGQAIVEYALSLGIAVVAVGVMAAGLRKSLFRLWTTLSKEIAAACPGCPASDLK